MCGITGIIAFNERGKEFLQKVTQSVDTLGKRGPDGRGIFFDENIALGHSRLAIIDTTEKASQPLMDYTGRYVIVFNGEFYNFQEHKRELQKKGYKFNSTSDTEVLLNLYIDTCPDGIGGSCEAKFLEKINGFFAFVIYDKEEKSLFIARDRLGVKPLLIYQDEDKLIFASEMKAILTYGIPKKIDNTALFTYLQLNYIPAPKTILQNVRKLTPGTYIEIKDNTIKETRYYRIPYNSKEYQNSEDREYQNSGDRSQNHPEYISFEDAQKRLIELIDNSVQRRLVADVPLGAFLSGGIDSSVIVATASKFQKDLKTFSIGYKDEPFFDETHYANLVAKKFKTDHTVYKLTNDDLFENLHNVLSYIDEPFADSSALPVYILSKYVRKPLKVALSGDGGDELFAGYNKHLAEYKALKGGLLAKLVKWTHSLWRNFPQSRETYLGNKIRQLSRFGEGMKLSSMAERYWRWCTFINEAEAKKIFHQSFDEHEYYEYKTLYQKHITRADLNDVLYADMHLVLPNDMLMKVDLMSMANGLEIREPFLDHHIVKFVFSLPADFKIDNKNRKKILRDTYKDILPKELYNRPKQGFEVPLLKWFRTELKSMIIDDLLDDNFIVEQKIFNFAEIKQLKNRLFTQNSGDITAQMWGLIVFQYWWKKYMECTKMN